MPELFMNAARFAALAEMYMAPVPSAQLCGRRLNTFALLVKDGAAHVVPSQDGPVYALTQMGEAKYVMVATREKRPTYARGLDLPVKPEPVTTNPVEAVVAEFDEPSVADLKARLAAVEAENARLKGEKMAKCTDIMFKLSGKGAISVLRLGRWPVTLYWNQWERLLERVDDLRKFAEQNKDKLASK
jgi:hypothetical protein